MAKEIVSIELDDSTLQSKLTSINKQLNENNKSLAKNNAEIKSLANSTKDLDKAFKQGAITADEYAEEVERVANQTSILKEENRGLQSENKKLSTDFRNLTAIQQEQAGSLNRLRAELRDATKEYDALSREQRENADIGGALQKRIEGLTTEVSKAEQATGRFQRQVGNYAGVGKTFADAIQAQGGALGKTIGSVKGFNAALSANPIGAVIMVIMPLISALQKMQPVTDAINIGLGVFNNVLDVIIQRIKLFLSLDFVGAFSGLGSAISDAATAGAEYAKIQKEIADRQQVQNVRNSEAEKQIAILNAQYKDGSKTLQERQAILEQINKIEEENFKEQSAITQLALDAEEKKVRALLKTNGVRVDELETIEQLIEASQRLALQDETFAKLVDLKVQQNKQEQESLAITEKAQARLNTLREQEKAKEEKALAEKKARLEKEAAARQAYNEKILSLQDEFFLNDRQKLEKSFNDKLDAIVGFSKREIELRLKILAAQEKALAEFDEKARQEAFNKLLTQTQQQTNTLFEQRKAGILANAKTDEELANQLAQLQFERQRALIEDEIALKIAAGATSLELDNQLIELQIANRQRLDAVEKQKVDNAIALADKERQAKVEAAQNVFGFVTSLARRGSAISKAAALGSIVAANAEAIAKGLASAVGVPFPANFPAIASVLGAVGSIIGQAKSVLGSADVQGFATGGLVTSGIPIRRSNGDNILATLKTGEVVLNQRQQSALGGAGTFRAIGVPGFATGGIAANTVTSPIDNNNSLVGQFTDALQDIQIFTAVTDINTGQSNFSKVVERAQI
jgi:hypothetical protein